jgi:asparaginyl-tRNA synthetase
MLLGAGEACLVVVKTFEATDVTEILRPFEDLSGRELGKKRQINRVFAETLKYLTSTFTGEGFDWLLRVVFSKSTDPPWPDPGASIEKRVDTEKR